MAEHAAQQKDVRSDDTSRSRGSNHITTIQTKQQIASQDTSMKANGENDTHASQSDFDLTERMQ